MAETDLGQVGYPLANNMTTETPGEKSMDAAQGPVIERLINDNKNAIQNKIIIGASRDGMIIATDQTVDFKNGIGIVNLESIAVTYKKTIRSLIAQLKSAGTTVITSAMVSENVATIKCTSLSGTGYSGGLQCTLQLFLC